MSNKCKFEFPAGLQEAARHVDGDTLYDNRVTGTIQPFIIMQIPSKPLSNKFLRNQRYYNYKFEKQSHSLQYLGNTGVQDGGEDELRAVQDPVQSGRPRSGLRAIRAARAHLPLLQPPEGPGTLQP